MAQLLVYIRTSIPWDKKFRFIIGWHEMTFSTLACPTVHMTQMKTQSQVSQAGGGWLLDGGWPCDWATAAAY